MTLRQADRNLVIRVLFVLLVLFVAILVLLSVIPVIFWLIDLTMLNHPKVCYSVLFVLFSAIQCYSVLFSAIHAIHTSSNSDTFKLRALVLRKVVTFKPYYDATSHY